MNVSTMQIQLVYTFDTVIWNGFDKNMVTCKVVVFRNYNIRRTVSKSVAILSTFLAHNHILFNVICMMAIEITHIRSWIVGLRSCCCCLCWLRRFVCVGVLKQSGCKLSGTQCSNLWFLCLSWKKCSCCISQSATVTRRRLRTLAHSTSYNSINITFRNLSKVWHRQICSSFERKFHLSSSNFKTKTLLSSHVVSLPPYRLDGPNDDGRCRHHLHARAWCGPYNSLWFHIFKRNKVNANLWNCTVWIQLIGLWFSNSAWAWSEFRSRNGRGRQQRHPNQWRRLSILVCEFRCCFCCWKKYWIFIPS